jgi:hypothetical protein
METITEDYVSFETAKLLKKKGYDEQTVRCYNLKKELCACQCIGDETINSTPNYLIAAPTFQMAMKWLRKKHNLHITTIPYAPMDRHPYHPGEADVVYIAQIFKGIIQLRLAISRHQPGLFTLQVRVEAILDDGGELPRVRLLLARRFLHTTLLAISHIFHIENVSFFRDVVRFLSPSVTAGKQQKS